MDRPRCEYCGKFISDEDLGNSEKVDGRLVWSGGYVPEPSHDEFWHIECKEPPAEQLEIEQEGK